MKAKSLALLVALTVLFLAHPQRSLAQSDPRDVFLSSSALTGKAVIEYDGGGVRIANINFKDAKAQQFLACNWGPDLLPLAVLTLEPSISLTLTDPAGKAVKKINLGVVGSIVSLLAVDIDNNGICDVLGFDKNGNGTLYTDVATNGAASSFAKLPARYNYDLLRKNKAIAGFISFGTGPSAAAKKKKTKKRATPPPLSLIMSSISGETLATLKIGRGIKKVIPLDYSSLATFALVKDSAIQIIDETGAILNTIKISKGSDVLAKDIKRLGYLQLIIPGDNSFTVFDPLLNSSENVILDTPPAVTPMPTATPTDPGGTGGGTNNFDPEHPGTGIAACNGFADYIQWLVDQGRVLEAQSYIPKVIQICADALNKGPSGDPSFQNGIPYLPPGQGQIYIRSTIHPKDGASDAVGPCSVMLNPFDGYKQGLTIKNSDTRRGTIAWLLPGGKEALFARVIDAKKFKTLQRLEDYGYAFPDFHGARHLYRSKGNVAGLGGKILVAVTNGLTECWALPKGKNRID